MMHDEEDEQAEAAILAQLLAEDASGLLPVMDDAALKLLASIAEESAIHTHPFFSKPQRRTVKRRRNNKPR